MASPRPENGVDELLGTLRRIARNVEREAREVRQITREIERRLAADTQPIGEPEEADREHHHPDRAVRVAA